MIGQASWVGGCGFLTLREVDSWLDDRLAPERREAFAVHQNRCHECALFGADLEAFRTVAQRGPLPGERREFERTVAIVKAHLRQKLESSEPQRGRFRFALWSWRYAASAVAASLLLMALALPLLRKDSARGGSLMIGDVAIEAPPLSTPPVVRGSESANGLWQRAEAAFAAEDYTAAAKALGEIAEREPESHDAVMYRGVALLLSGESAEALPVLQGAHRLAGEQGLSDITDSYWIGVAALDEGDAALARTSLEYVRDAQGRDASRAAALLDQLKGK